MFFLEKGGKKLTTFPKAADGDILEAGLEGLKVLALGMRGKTLKLQEIDGEVARKSEFAPQLIRFGFRDDYQGLILMVTP